MTNQTPSPVWLDTDVEQFVNLVQMSRHMGVKPTAAIVTLEVDELYCGAVLMLYVGEQVQATNKGWAMPLTPFFFRAEVATHLQNVGILNEGHMSSKTGVTVAWCEISETLI